MDTTALLYPFRSFASVLDMADNKTATFEITSFEEDVLQASHQQPVVADFWAPWCGPCRALGPALEKLAREQADKWTLAKINTDDNPEIAQRYQIRGIPAVKLFVDGEVVAEFTGALPEHQIRTWLDEHLPTEEKKQIEEARELWKKGRRNDARKIFEEIVEAEPEHDEARTFLAGLVVTEDPNRAEELIAEVDVADPTLLQIKDSVAVVSRLLELYSSPDSIPDGKMQLTYVQAIEALARDDFDAALERFIEVVQADREYDDDGARKACVALFTLLGNDHPVTKKHRRVFDTSLY